MVIGVLFGGRSVEHDISILSAIQVMNNLNSNKYQVEPLYLTKDLHLLTGVRYKSLKTYQQLLKPKKTEFANLIRKNGSTYLSKVFRKYEKQKKIDLILPIMHGKGVEDGNISGYLEILKIPYTSSKTLGASIAQDKELTKIVLQSMGIDVLDYEVNNLKKLSFPVIIKPAKLGSSIGITKAIDGESFQQGLALAQKYDDKVLIEKCLENFQEFSAACYFFKGEYILSEVEEVKLVSDIYTFTDKYMHNDKILENNHQIPANISKELTKKIHQITQEIYRKFELSGVIRVDYLYDLDTKKLYVNEINTIPGSLAYYLFKDKTMSSLLDDLITQCLIDQKKDTLDIFDSSVLVNNNVQKK